MKRLLVTGVVLVAIMLIGGCGKRGKPPEAGWGEAVNGLSMHLTGTSLVDADGSFEVTITIKNFSDKPITCPEGIHPAFNIVDKNNLPVQWQPYPQPVIIGPGTLDNSRETFSYTTRLDKVGIFTPTLQSGMKLTVTAVCDVAPAAAGNTWSGKLVSNPLSVSIVDDSWGEKVNGLHCYLAHVAESYETNQPMILEVILENTEPAKSVTLRAAPDNKKAPQLDVEIATEGGLVVFQSARSASKDVSFITLKPGTRIHTVVVPVSDEISKQIKTLITVPTGYQKAWVADKKIKLSEIPPGRYTVRVSYRHLSEKGKTYPSGWKNGWIGEFKSNLVTVNLIGGTPPPPQPPVSSSYIEIKTDKGKVTTLKKATTVANIKKALENLNPVKKPSKNKLKGTVTVMTDNLPVIYRYASDYLEREDEPMVQYQIPEVLKKQLK